MSKLESSVPGLIYPSGRDAPMKSAYGFLKGRQKDDGAEGLWRIRNGLYDLENFAKSHPGGAEWIRLTKGTDITEAFECHHITEKAERLLPKFYIRDAQKPRTIPLTFEADGFYRKFKKRAAEALKDINYHRPSPKSNLISDSLAIGTLALCLLAASTQQYITLIAAGIFLAWTTITGHNYFHMRDNFRMYYFDLSGMSSKNWRITHVMSHHLYPNTIWDHEIYAVEDFLPWLPLKNKSFLKILISHIASPFVYLFLFVDQLVKRYYSVFAEYGTFDFRDAVPFFLPLTMCFVAPNTFVAFKTWLMILCVGSFVFGFIGFNAAHHHPDIFHDGDIYRKDMDWGFLELDAVRDREVIDESPFLVLTNFGSHALHHLLPTVDHSYLPLALPAFLETCKEFGIKNEKWTSWELLKGQFQQLSRKSIKKNYR